MEAVRREQNDIEKKNEKNEKLSSTSEEEKTKEKLKLKFTKDNDIKIKSLQDEKRLIVITGAGVSMEIANHDLTWTNFTKALAAEAVKLFSITGVDVSVVSASTIKAWVEGQDRINHDNYMTYHDLVRPVFAKHYGQEENRLSQALSRIKLPIFTLNYDCYLEDALRRIPIDIRNVASNQSNFLSTSHGRYIVHVHGTYYSRVGFCLTDEEYKETQKVVVNDLYAIITDGGISYPMMLVGCNGTIEDDHFIDLLGRLKLRNIHLKINKIWCYWLVREGDVSRSEETLKKHGFELIASVMSFGPNNSDLSYFLSNVFPAV